MRRKLLTGFTAVAVTAALIALPGSASAEQRTLLVTLLGGKQVTVTVDVPPGTPINQISIPGLPGPVVSVEELVSSAGSAAQQAVPVPAPVPTAPAPATTTAPPATTTPAGSTTAPSAPTATNPKTSTTPRPGKPAVSPTQKARPKDEGATTAGARYTPDPSSADDSPADAPAKRTADGAPSADDPTLSLADVGPAPIGVPNFFISKFRIPPFLLPIYQAAGIEYGIRWEILAAINEIETDYGRNLNVSTAGAVGWMQFLPSTFRQYGVDANKDGRKDPYNPVDAIFSSARYLKAAGGDKDVRKAVFAYNHADWYVDSVLLRARLIGGLPADFVGSLTGLTQGHFPVHAKATYADDISAKEATRRIATGHNAAVPVEASTHRRSLSIYAKPGSPVIAVQDGKITKMGETKRLGRFIQLRDVYGNTYTYGNLKKLARVVPVPRPQKVSRAAVRKELALPKHDPKPASAASAGRQIKKLTAGKAKRTTPANARPKAVASTKERLFANPTRPSALKAGGREQILDAGGAVKGVTTFRSYFTQVYGLKRDEVYLKRLRPGSKVIAGTILGRIGKLAPRVAPHALFEIRPAGHGAPLIDPKPILDGWKLLESTAIYRAQGKNAFFGPDATDPTIGQVLLMSKEALQQRVLEDPRVEIYSCGQRDIEAGTVDRRVLAAIEFLSASGLRPTITSLRCGHSYLSASGNVSEHSSGDAVDVAKVNGIPILGHQGVGSITDMTIRRLLTLQGTMQPHQIISLMTYPGADNTLALPDHNDHIHIGFRPLLGEAAARKYESVLKPQQWIKLIDRLNTLDNPTVSVKPSKYAVRVKPPKRASRAHKSE